MYLKYIQIVNYKNLKNSKFEFGKGVNTVIGENDSGKSNAMTAMRILLDSNYYYNTKLLKENDFSDILDDWRGHWIIISAYFDEISKVDKDNEICSEISLDKENELFTKSYICCKDEEYGTVTLYIRPNKKVRKQLFNASGDEDNFRKIRSEIQLSDYEFSYKARSQEDFTDFAVYKKVVGDLENFQYADPENEDASIIGNNIDILNLWEHISVVFIDALRDVESEMHKTKNPMKRIFETIQSKIAQEDIDEIKEKVKDSNRSLSNIKQISNMGSDINTKLQDVVGLVYSPEVYVESRIKEDIDSIARYLSLNPAGERDIDSLGLGHLNILYIALKLVEFEANRNHEILNIMIVEEPEAHIHTHIQKTLFDNLKVSKNYTQVIMTTHSPHISEVSNIININVMKKDGSKSIVMRPINGLDNFGNHYFKHKRIKLSECLSRYLDARRSVLLFSKGVVLVEGDAEEILIPVLVREGLGISLDEIGVSVINIGSVGFENIASVFDESRIQRKCAIITDYDAIVKGAKKSKEKAMEQGKEREKKLAKLFGDNKWVESFYAPHTFEVDLANLDENRKYYKELVDIYYKRIYTINNYKNNIDGDEAKRYDAVLKLADTIGKGWMATILSKYIDKTVAIPDYIINAIAFASYEVVNIQIVKKMLLSVLTFYCDEEKDNHVKDFLERLNNATDNENIISIQSEFLYKFSNSNLAKFFAYQNRMKTYE